MIWPVVCAWTGSAFEPLKRFHNRCAELAEGNLYTLAEIEQRSPKSHAHFFASVDAAWRNLPDHLASHFQSADHLRKYALIRTGFCTETSFVASSKAEAARIAAFVRPTDEFAVVTVRERVVTRYVAKSQKLLAMDAREFQRAKQAVLDWIAQLIGTTSEALAKHVNEDVS